MAAHRRRMFGAPPPPPERATPSTPMPIFDLLFEPFERRRSWAPLFVRAFLATFLVYMTQDNVFSAARMLEFRDFLAARGTPVPLFSAHLSVYAQFTAGICFALGLLTRPAAAVMVINFVVAIVIAHLALPLRTWLEPLAMLSGSLFLLFNGPGPLALDRVIARRTAAGAESPTTRPASLSTEPRR